MSEPAWWRFQRTFESAIHDLPEPVPDDYIYCTNELCQVVRGLLAATMNADAVRGRPEGVGPRCVCGHTGNQHASWDGGRHGCLNCDCEVYLAEIADSTTEEP